MKYNDNKQKIYNAALELFFRKGYTDTAVSEIISLTDTNKGTFYHYFENKADLGLQVFGNIYMEHSNVSEFFQEADSLVLLALNSEIFWRVFFRDESFRRFITDLHRESVMYESRTIIDTCVQHSSKKIDNKTLKMIISANDGLRRSMTIHASENIDCLTFEQAATFYLTQLFRMFEIKQQIIDETLAKSFSLLERIEIVLDHYHYSLLLKE